VSQSAGGRHGVQKRDEDARAQKDLDHAAPEAALVADQEAETEAANQGTYQANDDVPMTP